MVTMQGKTITLVGKAVKVGEKAPDCTLSDNELRPVKLSSFRGKVLLLLTVPSLDTSVCSRESKRFNDAFAKMGTGAVACVVSCDLPFAQKRWCLAEGAKNIVTLSDYKSRDCGKAYGVEIQDLGLLARTVHLIDAEGTVRYVEIVPEVASEPNYDTVLKAVQDLLVGAK